MRSNSVVKGSEFDRHDIDSTENDHHSPNETMEPSKIKQPSGVSSYDRAHSSQVSIAHPISKLQVVDRGSGPSVSVNHTSSSMAMKSAGGLRRVKARHFDGIPIFQGHCSLTVESLAEIKRFEFERIDSHFKKVSGSPRSMPQKSTLAVGGGAQSTFKLSVKEPVAEVVELQTPEPPLVPRPAGRRAEVPLDVPLEGSFNLPMEDATGLFHKQSVGTLEERPSSRSSVGSVKIPDEWPYRITPRRTVREPGWTNWEASGNPSSQMNALDQGRDGTSFHKQHRTTLLEKRCRKTSRFLEKIPGDHGNRVPNKDQLVEAKGLVEEWLRDPMIWGTR